MNLSSALSVAPLPGRRLHVVFPASIQQGPRNRHAGHLNYCYICERENYALAVAAGQCAWCGWQIEKPEKKD
jgi:hypothetical protein